MGANLCPNSPTTVSTDMSTQTYDSTGSILSTHILQPPPIKTSTPEDDYRLLQRKYDALHKRHSLLTKKYSNLQVRFIIETAAHATT